MIKDYLEGEVVVDPAPFINEWPALTLKLMLLHAAARGVDAMAWTRGAHQVSRYRGLGKGGGQELYDRTLPREAKRLLKPYGVISEALEVTCLIISIASFQSINWAYRVITFL